MKRKKSSIIFNILIVIYLIIMITLVFRQFDNFIFGSLIIDKNLIVSINNIVEEFDTGFDNFEFVIE